MVSIKIRKNQKAWLTDTASTVRNNNSEPVPPAERVYPQHLIGVAIAVALDSASLMTQLAEGIDFLEAAGIEQLNQ